jgi:hypothetical protein
LSYFKCRKLNDLKCRLLFICLALREKLKKSLQYGSNCRTLKLWYRNVAVGLYGHVNWMISNVVFVISLIEQATREHGQWIRIKEDLYGMKSQSVYGKWRNRIWKDEREQKAKYGRHWINVYLKKECGNNVLLYGWLFSWINYGKIRIYRTVRYRPIPNSWERIQHLLGPAPYGTVPVFELMMAHSRKGRRSCYPGWRPHLTYLRIYWHKYGVVLISF